MASKAKEAATKADEAEGADAEAAPPQKPKRKIILIAGLALALLSAGGAGGYVMLSSKKEDKPTAAASKPPVFLDIPDVLVNLSNTGSDRTHYLKLKVVLELPDQALLQQVQPVLPRVMDTFQTFLRELRPIDLEGSAGLYRLKDELTRRVNVAIAPSRVNAVLFKEIVVQ